MLYGKYKALYFVAYIDSDRNMHDNIDARSDVRD